MMVSASAPGKVILLGEHAVVYGKPAVAVAIDRRFACSVHVSDMNMLNGRPISIEKHPYIHHMMLKHGIQAASVDTVSDIPAGSGLGSSAALSASLSAAMRCISGVAYNVRDVAEDAFDTEYTVQGRASPIDTSVCTYGRGIVVNDDTDDLLLSVSRDGNTWNISGITVPEMTIVVGYTGLHAATGPLVERVRRFREKNRFASDIVDEIGDVTIRGIKMIKNGDLPGLGELMTCNHKLLSILGVSCKELNKLVDAVLPYSYGAKLTGAGGGGSMIALTDRPEKVSEMIEKRGCVPFTVRTNVKGVSVSK